MAIVAASKSMCCHRSASSSPRRMPVTMTNHTNVPQEASASKAAVTSRAASAADGGRGSGQGAAGLRASSAGLRGIQPQRTALLSAVLMIEWIWRTDDAKGLHRCMPHSKTGHPAA